MGIVADLLTAGVIEEVAMSVVIDVAVPSRFGSRSAIL
jgi:hypothetical protein